MVNRNATRSLGAIADRDARRSRAGELRDARSGWPRRDGESRRTGRLASARTWHGRSRAAGRHDAQQEQVHTVFAGMHKQMESDRQAELADLPAFGNPGDPQYAAAVQAAQTRASARIRRWSEAQQQVYAILTPQQQAQLTQLLSAMQQHLASHAAHGAAAAPSN